MNTWHLLHPIQRDKAWKAHQEQYKYSDHDILSQWQQTVRSKLNPCLLATLHQHYQQASTNRHQPSLYHYESLSSDLQEMVHVLHILHAQKRQDAVLSPRFDYLTKEYLEHYR